MDKNLPILKGGGEEEGWEREKGTKFGEKLKKYACEYTWEKRLDEGEILVFNNRRMLHGRNGFTMVNSNNNNNNDNKKGGEGGKKMGKRHLVGCYTNMEDTLSRYRVLMRGKEGVDVRAVLNVGNGSHVIP